MCGIAGMIGVTRPTQPQINAALESMGRRGPDAKGSYSGQLGNGSGAVTLLHTRLSIIDLDSRSHQPFVDDGIVLIYNGELYNFIELKRELERLGHSFRTDSDTEVVVRAWRQWGTDCLDRFEGMWAFALFDEREGTLHLSRDRFGEKPLFLAYLNGALYFASEVKAIAALSGSAPRVNISQIRRYLVNGYKSLHKRGETYFEGVSELPAGTVAKIDSSSMPTPKRYWSLAYRPQKMSEAEAIEGTRAHLLRALNIRLRADVPIAFCLSGGIDSGTLASMAVKEFGARVHAFSIVDSDERYDEAENLAAVVADLGCDHYVVRTATDGFFERLSDLVSYHDSPVATISYYVHSFLSQAISDAGYRVALSGTGADEIFTGYYDHYAFWLAEMMERPDAEALLDDWRRTYGRFVQNPLLKEPLRFRDTPQERGHIYLKRELYNRLLVEECVEDFEEESYGGNLLRRRMLNELFHESVPVILNEDDLNSMRYSVENRSPYLDRQLAEFLYSVPNEYLIANGLPKWILRAAGDGYLTDKVRLDPRKRGFNASIDSLLDRRDPRVVERLMADSPIFDVVKRDAIKRFVDGDMSSNADSKFMFSFVSAKLFLESDLARGRHAKAAEQAA
jgi:asparagine synthase (glutamine-hydrolysing)